MIGVFEELMVYIKILNDILLFIYFENLQIQQKKKIQQIHVHVYLKGRILIIHNYSLLMRSINGFINLASRGHKS